MISAKQKKFLRSMCNRLKPKIQIGKEGLSPAFLEELSKILENNELVKVAILQNAPMDRKEIFKNAPELLNAVLIQSIGRKFCIYRRSSKKQIIFFPE